MADKQARADVAHIRQTTQFTCCAASIAAALKAHGKNVSEDDVNKVLGAAPMAGATWEAMLATVQYFGLRGSLVVPSTPRMLKAWTDQGLPVLIAWNPENRPWSHASVVFDVVEGADGVLQVHVMDPNIPNPSRHVRVLDEDEFCQKWGEKVSDTLIVRRPAMVVEREVTVEGRQVRASTRTAATPDWDWKPWAKVVVDWFEENLGDRPQVSVNLITKDTAKPYYYVSFLLPAGPGSSSAFNKWMYDNKVLRRWRSFKNRWSKWGLISNGTGDTEFHLQDGTFVQIMGLGFGSSPLAVKIAETHLRQKEAEAHDCYKDYKGGGLTWEEYQDCLKRFKDEDDWGYGGRPRYPTKAKTPVPVDYAKRARRLLMALWFTRDNGRKFVKDNLYARELTDAQHKWFGGLEQKYSRVMADLPENPNLSFGTDGSLFLGLAGLSEGDKTKVLKHFDYKPERNEWVLYPKGSLPVAAPPPPPAPAPVAPTPGRNQVDPARQTQMLAVLDTLINRTNSGMLKGFKRDLEMGKGLTEDQLKAIRHNLYKSGMRPEADLFRVASLREAGEREVERLGTLRAFWLFNSARQRVYGILDSSIEGDPEVGMIAWDRKSDTWKVEQWLDTDQNYKRPLGSFTASDAREGVKRALLTFQDQRVKSQQESPVSKSAKAPTPVTEKKDPNKFTVEGPARRNPIVQQMIERGPGGAGKHHNRERDVEKGKSRKEKHKKPWGDKEAAARVADRFLAEQE